MIENITNVTGVNNTVASALTWDTFPQIVLNLTTSQLFGVADAAIVLIAIFGYEKIAKNWKLSLFLFFIFGLLYNVLFQLLPRQEIAGHAIFLFLIILIGIGITGLKKEI